MSSTYCPHLTQRHKKFLQALFPNDQCLFAPEQMHIFGTDASRMFKEPWAVVRPVQIEQIKELMAWAHRECIPIIPRANGTNVVGDCVPVQGGVVVSCQNLNRVLQIDSSGFTAEVEPGVVTHAFQSQVRKLQLYYPPDPASAKISTIGGNVSTNAGGLKAIKYGVTRDYVLGLSAVLPGGDIIHTGGQSHKDVAGLDLTRLMVGSEGTLGYFVRIFLKLLPLPGAEASVLVGFKDIDSALQGAQDVLHSGILPVALEFMDNEVIFCLKEAGCFSVSEDATVMLLIKLEGSETSIKEEMEILQRILRQSAPEFLKKAGNAREEEQIWEIRRMISPCAFQLGEDKLSLDIAVPRGKVGQAILNIKEVGRHYELPILTFGHLGDGNIHVNIMYSKSIGEELKKTEAAVDAVLREVLGLQGTISGEHGIGLVKLNYLQQQHGPKELAIMRGIKNIFDPRGIMNPGKAY